MSKLAYQYDVMKKEELIDGKIVMMSPRPAINHNRIVTNISGIFDNYLKGKRCQPFCDGTEVWLDEKNHFIPDAMIVCNPDIIGSHHIDGAPDLVVEVLSPSTYDRDMTVKMAAYARAGVKEYWIVEPEARRVAVHLLKGDTYELSASYYPYTEEDYKHMDEEDVVIARQRIKLKVSLYDDLVIDVADIFERVK